LNRKNPKELARTPFVKTFENQSRIQSNIYI